MSLPLRDREMTVEDLYVMPDDGFNYELQAGMLVSESAPGFRHGHVVAAIADHKLGKGQSSSKRWTPSGSATRSAR